MSTIKSRKTIFLTNLILSIPLGVIVMGICGLFNAITIHSITISIFVYTYDVINESKHDLAEQEIKELQTKVTILINKDITLDNNI